MNDSTAKRPIPFPVGLQRFLEGKVPDGPAPEPRPAATVALVRDGAEGLETFLVQRARGMKFLGGAHVFPGGRVDAADGSARRAAVREVEEEVDVRLEPEALLPWSRWITPEVEPRRFDAMFFVAALPPGERARAVEGEAIDGLWITPRAALERTERGEMVLAPPTLWTLLELACYDDVAAVLAAEREIEVFRPRPHVDAQGRLELLLRGDAGYENPDAEVPESKQRRLIFTHAGWIVRGAPGEGSAA